VFVNWLKGGRLRREDVIFVLSVGGGSWRRTSAPTSCGPCSFAKETGAAVLGVVGRDGGYTAKVADACCIIRPSTREHHAARGELPGHRVAPDRLAPHDQAAQTKWESPAKY
jgi:D-sedoheptulose 7-phosphate isomerase